MLALLLVLAAPVSAETVRCGSTITRPGSYTLASSCTGGLWIRSNDVRLSLNGGTLKCGSNKYGISAPRVRGLRVHSGRITACYAGLYAPRASKVLVDSVDFSGNLYMGLMLGGPGNTIRNSIFAKISGYPASGYAIGINNPGPDCSITGNTFRELYKQSQAVGEGVGILLKSGSCVIQHNWIENTSASPEIGIWIAETATGIIRENVITNYGRAIVGSGDVYASDNRLMLRQPVPRSHGIYGRAGVSSANDIRGFETPVSIPSFGDTIQ